ncbi:EpsG family protein [Pseudomonas sp. M30-35]|uniref:EpsG family protein n=1 Tax=Pseudomonas sp. M30-35 TaxID=1981174 RepID=UPI000B3D4EBE|nr:EpsG family protein [Pseudomonas sp. M30-35]ARU88045.1 hypothetical protein B9K09_08735 [Pseudomonas sp. M30-35]
MALWFFVSSVLAISSLFYKSKPLVCMLWLFITVVVAFRFNIGSDYLGYVVLFDQYERMWPKDFGFYAIASILNFGGLNSQALFVFYAVVTCLFNALAVNKFSKLGGTFGLLSFVFFALMLFPSLNVIRQAAAAAIIFYALYFACERRWLIYLSLIVMASTFHLSALLMVFVIPYFFVDFKKNTCLLLYLVPIFFVYVDVSELIKFAISYSGLYAEYADFGRFSRAVTFVDLIKSQVQILFCFVLSLLVSKYTTNTRFSMFIIKGLLLTAILLSISVNMAVVGRLYLYFKPFAVLAIALLISNLSSVVKQKNMEFVSIFTLVFTIFIATSYSAYRKESAYRQFSLNFCIVNESCPVAIYGDYGTVERWDAQIE